MEKIKRPKETQGTTTRVETGCGHLYVTVGKDNGNIIEVFATLGKAGGCAKAQGEAITRALTLGLKYGIPVEEFIKEFDNIRCPSPAISEREQIYSCADAIAKVLKKEVKKKDDKAEVNS
jgi:ribonucleoside-diphosphate reductase alpha chain